MHCGVRFPLEVTDVSCTPVAATANLRRMAVVGVNHITLSSEDVGASVGFYRDTLGFEVVATWPHGAYLSALGLWLAIVPGPRETRVGDYSHIAFHVDRHEFARVANLIVASGAEIWQDNWTEGDSLYFTDPDGHRLEVHATTFAARVESATAAPWEGLSFVTAAASLARPVPSVADPRKPRRLHCAPVGVFVVVVDDDSRILFLRDPADGQLQVPNGARERDEEPIDTARRELAEEAGPIEVGDMQCFSAYNVDYHPHLPSLISIGFVCGHLAGAAKAGDDMQGFDVEWLTLDQLSESELFIPAEKADLAPALAVLRSCGGKT